MAISSRRVFVIVGMAAMVAATTPVFTGQQASQADLQGVIDIHTHTEPDSTKRVMDVFELARAARARGMRGIVIKDHYQPTASVAFLVRKIVPELEAFGGVTMDLANGGINPAAVENMAKVSGGYGRVVWMPTSDSEATVKQGAAAGRGRPFVSVSKDGTLLPDVRRVISIIAANNLVLATGHSSAAEHLLLVREGERVGLRRHMVVTHAPFTPGGITIAQMQEATRAGAFIELCAMFVVARRPTADAVAYADIVRHVGAQWVIVSTDLGQPDNPTPPEGMAQFIAALKRAGISQADIDLMTKKNPAELLRLAY